jgi:uncharacterized protein with HEPN domain
MMRFACVKQIEIIGEAANYITPETKAIFSDLEWGQIVGMRIFAFMNISEWTSS